jgi:hypothetical protein
MSHSKEINSQVGPTNLMVEFFMNEKLLYLKKNFHVK